MVYYSARSDLQVTLYANLTLIILTDMDDKIIWSDGVGMVSDSFSSSEVWNFIIPVLKYMVYLCLAP